MNHLNRRLNDAQNRSRKSLGEVDGSSDGGTSPQMPRSQSGVSVRSRKSIPSQKSTSRTSVDEPLCISAELHDLPEGSESGDSETATEVDVNILQMNSSEMNEKLTKTIVGIDFRLPKKHPSLKSTLKVTGIKTFQLVRVRAAVRSVHR